MRLILARSLVDDWFDVIRGGKGRDGAEYCADGSKDWADGSVL